MIIWLTGPSGAGKSTIARELQKHIDAVVLDGDEMRNSISVGLGFSREERKENNHRIARLAKELERQKNVIVSVIAPMEEVREEIDKICSPFWVYVKRTLPEREGHFYEPGDYFTIDHDKLSVKESVREILKLIESKSNNEKKVHSLFIGRYQPLHEGHIKLMKKVLDEGKNICVGLRDTKIDESNPYTVAERVEMFKQAFGDLFGDKVKVISLPDIEEVCYGRKVGWGMREIKLDAETESISATKIRGEMKNNGNFGK